MQGERWDMGGMREFFWQHERLYIIMGLFQRNIKSVILMNISVVGYGIFYASRIKV